MKRKDKQHYLTPAVQVFEVKTEGVICVSTLQIMWMTSDPTPAEINWGRSSYGDANTDTWN